MTPEQKRAYHKVYYEKNKDKIRQRVNAWKMQHPDRVKAIRYKYDSKRDARRIVSVAKSNAKQQGVPFDLVPGDVVVPDKCPVFGTPFEYNTWQTASIDRIIPDKGYVKGNVQIISKLANTMKSKATPDQLKQFAEWVLA